MAKKVLIIDDDVNTVRFLSVALEEHGMEADGAYDGREGLAKIEADTPDLVILDVMMPKKTGFVLFKQLRKDERFKHLPVVMLTGVAESLQELDEQSEDTHERPYDALREKFRAIIQSMKEDGLDRPDMFIDKPIDPEIVVEKVKDLLGALDG